MQENAYYSNATLTNVIKGASAFFVLSNRYLVPKSEKHLITDRVLSANALKFQTNLMTMPSIKRKRNVENET